MNDNNIQLQGRAGTRIYNGTKYHIFTAIAVLQHYQIPATSKTIAYLTGIRYRHVVKYLINYESYLLAKPIRKSPDNCRLKYGLSAKGKRVQRVFLDRHENGFDLNIRRVPKKQDWSKFKLIPNMEEKIDKLQSIFEGYKP